jgi:endonuclease V-like protein UPF0215 family
MLNNIKDGIHTVAIDDARYMKGETHTDLFFVFCRGQFLEKVIRTEISIDGTDGTDAIIQILSGFKQEFRLIVTHGVTFGGFNVVDIRKIHRTLEKPIITVTENKPIGDNMINALKNLPDHESKINMIHSAGELYTYSPAIGQNNLYFHIMGITEEKASEYLKKFGMRSRLPEPLLLAHKIASGIRFEMGKLH